jgi:Spy/CpxP family protein refolding chaperone
MKTWLKRTLFGLFGATLVLGGLAACGRHHHGGQAMTEEDFTKLKTRVVDKAGAKLDLDAAQKAKLGLLADKLREQRTALMTSGGDPRAELQAIVAGASFDRARAKALVDGKTAAVQQRSPELIAAAADFYDSLKPEQQAKVREWMSARGRGGWRS